MSLSIDERFGLDIEPEQPPHPLFLAGKAAGRKEAIADMLRFLREESNHVGRIGCAREIERHEAELQAKRRTS